MSGAEEALAGGVGGPGREDFANGAAALSAALVREAQALAQTAADLATVSGSSEGSGARGAASRAVLALSASSAIVETDDIGAQAARLSKAAEYQGVSLAIVAAMLRAAALTPLTDDAAARIAAMSIAQTLADQLLRGGR